MRCWGGSWKVPVQRSATMNQGKWSKYGRNGTGHAENVKESRGASLPPKNHQMCPSVNSLHAKWDAIKTLLDNSAMLKHITIV